MHTTKKGSLALVAGTAAGLLTMALHPTAGELAASIAGGGRGLLGPLAHSLALAAQPLILAGTLVLTLRFTTQRDIAVAAFIVYAWSSVAIMIGGTASGFVATGVLTTAGSDAGAADTTRVLLRYTWLLNQAFIKLYVAFSSLAIVIWSAAMLREGSFGRGLAIYGVISGVGLLAGVLGGLLELGIHGFGAVVLLQGIWLVWVAAWLWRQGDVAGRGAAVTHAPAQLAVRE